jgi:CheY-like chemotaxis protein
MGGHDPPNGRALRLGPKAARDDSVPPARAVCYHADAGSGHRNARRSTIWGSLMSLNAKAATVSTGTASVVVVDDDPLQRNEIIEYLMRAGISVSAAPNGFAAMHEIRKLSPRVVVMDMKMPGLDGIHVARLIEGLDPRPKVILVSGYPEYVYRAHQEDLGVFAVIEKPVPLKSLLRFILAALKA